MMNRKGRKERKKRNRVQQQETKEGFSLLPVAFTLSFYLSSFAPFAVERILP
jgi:hypothetical protein